MKKNAKNDILALLPLHIIKKSKNWYINTKTGKRIHTSNILAHVPKTNQIDYSGYWWNK